jgi:hypothetical protein
MAVMGNTAGTYSVTHDGHVRNSEIKQLRSLFFPLCMIFGRVMTLGLLNLAKYLVVTTFTMIWDIDLIFGMLVYNDELQINFEIHLLFLAYYWGN